jgi:hypothetical protein
VRDLTEAEARDLTGRIKGQVAGVLELITAAFEGRADVALGYPTWAHYCIAEFPAIRYETKAQRNAAIVQLGQHMSGRAAAHALGISETEARRQLREARAVEQAAPNGAARSNQPLGLDRKLRGERGGDRCKPIPVRARITTALIHYARQAAALTADLAAQDYPPGWVTPAEQEAIIRFRAAQEDFTRTIEREEARREDTA